MQEAWSLDLCGEVSKLQEEFGTPPLSPPPSEREFLQTSLSSTSLLPIASGWFLPPPHHSSTPPPHALHPPLSSAAGTRCVGCHYSCSTAY